MKLTVVSKTTTSLASSAMLKIPFNRVSPQAERIIAEEQVSDQDIIFIIGFEYQNNNGTLSTTSTRVFHAFNDLRGPLTEYGMINLYNINANIIKVIWSLYRIVT